MIDCLKCVHRKLKEHSNGMLIHSCEMCPGKEVIGKLAERIKNVCFDFEEDKERWKLIEKLHSN